MTIGQAIRKCRKDKGITQTKLAELIGCVPCQISHWEMGRQFPSILSCITLADTLGVSLDELVGRSVKE